ncbi:MAG: carbohydrate ABC transporter permease [Bacillota bacterium]|jgi:putative aldouronate transport system permease protein|nr:carbohydrate ABC transporter permease [Bacillota bacterium]
MARNHIKSSLSSKIFDVLNYLFMLLLMVAMIYPFWNTFAVSLNDALDSIKGGIYLLPRKFTLYNYATMFSRGTLLDAAFISVSKTLIVTILNVFLSSLAAYVLSRKNFVFRKFMTIFLVLTMYVNAGLIPQFFLFQRLGLINKYWVYIVPNLIGAFNVIVIRTFMNGLPESLAESARIDGAGEFRTFVQIIMPLCKPVLATVALWVAVGTWNSWFDTFIFASRYQKLSTLQYEMMKLLSSSMIQSGTVIPGLVGQTQSRVVTPTAIRAAMTIIAALPIIFVYPFLQKYFVQGLHLGSVKG